MDEEEMFALNLRAERERRRQQLQHAEYVKAFGRIIDEYVERVGGELGVPREVFEREARKEFELALDRGFGAYYFLYVPLPSDKPVAAPSVDLTASRSSLARISAAIRESYRRLLNGPA